MINYEVKFWTCDESVQIKSSDFKSFKYEVKKRVDETAYESGKRSFHERRGGHWRCPRPRQLRQLESKLRERSIVACEWTSDCLVTIVFSSGAIAYLTVKPDTLDVAQILFDRYFVGKLSGQIVTSVALCKNHILFSHTSRTATFVTLGKCTPTNQPCRITDRDPLLQSIELGGSSRRAERCVSHCENNTEVRVLVWSASTAEPAPWSPVIEDHANLHLYHIQGKQISMLAYHQLENETLSAELSYNWDNLVHIVEQTTCHKNGVTLNWIRYEVTQCSRPVRLVPAPTRVQSAPTRVQSSSARSQPAPTWSRARLPAPARALRRSPCDQKLVLSCIDGSLHVLHHSAGLTHTTRAGFISTEVQWAGDLIVAAEEGGRLQCFDRALSLLHHHTKCLDFTDYFREARHMKLLASRGGKCGPTILAFFTGGPLALLHITHPSLITAWTRGGRSPSAVSLLGAMNWRREGNQCLRALTHLMCTAMRGQPGGGWREDVAQAALGTYLGRHPEAHTSQSSSDPHDPHAPSVHDLARKFFHHLLRRGRVEKALSLCVELRGAELCADVRWAAARRGLPALAHEAAALAALYAANHPESECSDSCSQCSSGSYSGSEDEASVAFETVRTQPPPLPRVSLPHTTIPVPLTLPEPPSTTSIRPNLHQYLERDSTIWNTNVRDDTYITNRNPTPDYSQSVRWHSVDVLSKAKLSLPVISESPLKNHTSIDVRQEERLNTHFKHIFQELRQEPGTNTLYRYQNNNNYFPSSSVKDRQLKTDNDPVERQAPRTEKNKVKFSDTVTIAVMSESGPEAGLPLAGLSVAGSTLDYVEV